MYDSCVHVVMYSTVQSLPVKPRWSRGKGCMPNRVWPTRYFQKPYFYLFLFSYVSVDILLYNCIPFFFRTWKISLVFQLHFCFKIIRTIKQKFTSPSRHLTQWQALWVPGKDVLVGRSGTTQDRRSTEQTDSRITFSVSGGRSSYEYSLRTQEGEVKRETVWGVIQSLSWTQWLTFVWRRLGFGPTLSVSWIYSLFINTTTWFSDSKTR